MALMCHENFSDVPPDDHSLGHQEAVAHDHLIIQGWLDKLAADEAKDQDD